MNALSKTFQNSIKKPKACRHISKSESVRRNWFRWRQSDMFQRQWWQYTDRYSAVYKWREV